MSTNQPEEEAPSNVTTDAESQEYGAQHGQDKQGRETGTSAGETAAGAEEERTGEGTGARGRV